MIVVYCVVAVLVVVLIGALYSERVPPLEPRPDLPPWDGFPGTADIRRAGFRLTLLGYDRRVVQQHLDRVAVAFEAALTAREAVATRQQRDLEVASAWPLAADTPPPPPASAAVTPPPPMTAALPSLAKAESDDGVWPTPPVGSPTPGEADG